MFSNVTSGLISGFVTGTIALLALYANYRRSLDGDSKWRANLFDAASAKEITIKEVQVLRTALRYEPHDNSEIEMGTFDWITNIMIYFCEYLTLKYYEDKSYQLNYQEQEIVRVFIRCLLKNHWEYNASMISSFGKLKEKRNRQNKPSFINESFEKAKNIYSTLDDENIIEKLGDR